MSFECNEGHIACNNAGQPIPDGIPKLLDNDGWVKCGKDLITNFYSMYQPEVVYVPEWDVPDGYPYIMWIFAWAYSQENDPVPEEGYEGYKGGDSVFCARARQAEGPWEVYAVKDGEFYWDNEQNPFYWYPVILCGDTWYDSWHIGDPSVVYKDGKFYMALSSMGCDVDMIPYHKPGDTDGNSSCILGAVSTDGIHFEKSEAPLVVWEHEMGFNERENPKDYYGGHQRPSLMFEDGKWRMWYDVRGSWVGYAECEGDFMNPACWREINNGHNPQLHSVDFDVVKIGSIYYAVGDPYIDWEGVKDDTVKSDPKSSYPRRQIMEYRSYDGFKWKATGYFRPDEGYMANQIPQYFLDHKNNRVCIFYAVQKGGHWPDGSYDWRWKSIRMVYRDIKLFEKP